MSKNLKVMNLTEDNFKEFGSIISIKNRRPDVEDQKFGWYEKLGFFKETQNISLNILKAKKREFEIDKLEYHKETPEAIIPIGGERVVVVVAPEGDLDESKIKAFYINKNEGVMLNKGVRHFIPYPLEVDTECLIVFKHGTGVDDLVYEQLSGVYKIEL
jgi:ureidoglycolate lyase